ncbi:protein LOL2 isoform X2 [Cryptomeria japonica]|uniref:protein LOL2 isoform X2 n=1 Tax=Cryptomeria japonica TaxID=3369 RepID=UPI0025AC933F|nr:protein LOL2 isoform X2 [Cryptomeria japonica]
MLSGSYAAGPAQHTRSDSVPMNNGSANGPIGGGIAQPPRVGSMANNNPGVARPGWGAMPIPMGPYAPQPMPVPPPNGTEMAQLICGGCRTLLMYVRGATSVQCSCCHTVNLAMEANQVAHVNCGNCCTTLMYPFGAPSVKCALCHFVTAVGMNNMRMPLPAQRPPTASVTPPSSSSVPPERSQSQTVVVENPMTVDESGKLVSNVAVGVTTEKS